MNKKNYNLDLHGVKHVDVGGEVDRFIGEHLMDGSKSVIVITGNSDEVKNLVGKTIADYGLTYTESWGRTGEVSISLI